MSLTVQRYNPQVAASGSRVQDMVPYSPAIQVAKEGIKALEAYHDDQSKQDLINKVSDLRDKSRLIRESELARQGSNAYGSVDRGSTEIEKVAQEHLKDIDPKYRTSYLQYASSVRGSLLDSLASHEMGQRHAAMQGSINSAVQVAQNDVYDDPGQLGQNQKLVEDQLTTLGVPKGLGYYRKAKAVLQQSALDGIADADPNAAKVFLAQNRGQFDEKTIRHANKIILANEKTQAYLQAKAVEKAQNNTMNDFIVHMDTLTPRQVRESNLPPVGSGSKEHFLDVIKKRDAPGKSAYDMTQGQTLAEILELENDPTKPALTPHDIMGYVGKGLSAKDAQKLIGSIDLVKNPVFKSTEMALKTNFGYEGVLKGFGHKQGGAILYNRAIADILENWKEGKITSNNAKQLQQEIFSIAAPYLKEYMRKYLGASDADISSRLAEEGVTSGSLGNILNPNPKGQLEFKDGKWQ